MCQVAHENKTLPFNKTLYFMIHNKHDEHVKPLKKALSCFIRDIYEYSHLNEC